VSERLPAPDAARFPALAKSHVKVVKPGTLVGRIHAQGGPHPTTWGAFRWFGPTSHRFDHQPPPPRVHPTRGILYGATPRYWAPVLETCVLECYQDRRVIELRRDDPYFVLLRTMRPLRLLDVADSSWLARAGGNSALSSGLRSTARDWSRAIYRTYPDVDGLYYASSLNPAARNVALYERARSAMPQRPDGYWPLSHPALRAELEEYAATFGLGLLA
jgi:hypothetical protein